MATPPMPDDAFIYLTRSKYMRGTIMPADPRLHISLSENHKRILWQLRSAGPTPRTRLADQLGVGPGAMTRLTRELATLGMVEERDQDQSMARGRPTVPLAISGHGGYAAGATTHPGWIEIALVDFAGQALVRDSVAFDDPDPRAFAQVVDRRLRTLAIEHGLMRRRFLGLGIAVPGYVVDAETDRRWTVDRMAGWRDVSLTSFFADALDLPVWTENDGAAAALAEYYQPAIIGRYRSVLVFFLSHGVGGGLVAERGLFRGEHGNAGEIGRLFPGPVERPSGIDLLRTLRKAGVAIDSLEALEPLLHDHAGLFTRWMDRVATQLRVALAAGVAWLDPGAVVISGALPQPILDGLVARLGDWEGAGYRATMPDLHASRLRSTAVATGAAMIPIHALTADR